MKHKRVENLISVRNCEKCYVNKGYWGELSCEIPKVPFCTPLDALLIRMTDLHLHKNLLLKACFPLYSRPLTFLKFNFSYLLIIINYPCFIRCVNTNKLTVFYMSLIFTVKGTSEQTSTVQAFNFVGKAKHTLLVFNSSYKLFDMHSMSNV